MKKWTYTHIYYRKRGVGRGGEGERNEIDNYILADWLIE